jgi:FG-GAP-like repeat/FG-GAP repeat/Tetratricopeptide repeat
MSKDLTALVLVALTALGLALAQNSPGSSEMVASAQTKIAGGDVAGATAILEKVVAADPKNQVAWRLLGFSYLKQKKVAESRAAYEKLLALSPNTPQALYNIGVGYAVEGNKDAAFEWLGKAKATGKLDMTQIQVDEDLKALAGDPRFAALLPKPQDFANPFVESEKVVLLREWDGEAQGDQFGWIARNLGDVDGDGVADVVTSAPSNAAGGKDAGRVYVYSTKTGKLLWKVDGAAAAELGTGVERAGDTNRDGVPDVVASAPGEGKAYVYSGRDGRVLVTLSAENKTDTFGRHASSAGDPDGDGHADVIIGAPTNAAGGKDAGRAYVFSGKDGRKLVTWTGERAGDGFGSTVAGYTDGKTKLILVGAPRGGPRNTGRVYVYEGLAAKPKFVIESDETGNALGYMFVSVPGDFDGDGMPDIFSTDFNNTARGPSTGRAYVHSGKNGKVLLTMTGETQGEGFGVGPATTGDVDGDGRPDLVIGAWQYAGAAVSGGRAYLYSGKDGKVLKTYTCRIPGDTFGFDAIGMGDTDGDGTVDLLITSGWSGVKGNHSGRVLLISSGVQKTRK